MEEQTQEIVVGDAVVCGASRATTGSIERRKSELHQYITLRDVKTCSRTVKVAINYGIHNVRFHKLLFSAFASLCYTFSMYVTNEIDPETPRVRPD